MQDSIYLLTLRSHFISNVCTLYIVVYVSNSNHNIEMSLSAFRNLGSAHT